MDVPTIEFVLQSSAGSELDTLNHKPWQCSLKDKADEVIRQNVASDPEARQSLESILRPASFFLQLGKSKAAWM